MPWLHLHVDTQGLVKACCSTSVTFGDLSKNSIQEIWQGQAMGNFRQQVLTSGVDRRCTACLHREVAGKSSMRTETLSKYPVLAQKIQDEQLIDGSIRPIYLDIRFSNICNLKCRTCWHGASSSWYEEAKQLKNTAGEQAIIRATTDNAALIAEVMDQADEIEEVYFAGGEPLMMEEHYRLLERLLDQRQQPLIRYNTNLSVLQLKSQEVIPLWQKFDKVQLSVSIDALGQQAEYIRKGLKWNQLLDNLLRVQNECPHVQVEIAPTVSVFNVMELGAIHRYFFDKQLIPLGGIYLNLLERPLAYNITHLKDKDNAQTKLEAHIEWIAQLGGGVELRAEFQSIIDYMHSRAANPKYQMQFDQMTRRLDLMRKEDYRDIFEKKSDG
ncbi:hypothetical protein BFP72_07980 [Reichenbachiella sp. 5M10]|uniref:twitch domain-containing radical SAM protein n=1 Tax=Reichenbachiella sp. 5M10 TaxID=1889772 RepID=UPI000C151D55|nr:twitch domain-containing radical SAM protein [Reichenbachiella sp. 5M10]PIB35338.1 hypothetical protein BFP72_07980 [Reichenbachiella sp. 5M10]